MRTSYTTDSCGGERVRIERQMFMSLTGGVWGEFVAIQGTICSATTCKEIQNDFSMAAETIAKWTYMDNSMDSVLNELLGIELYHHLLLLLSLAGMHARKWLSNSPKVLAKIPQEDRKAEVDLDRSQSPCAKSRGLLY